jgi:hypothetical protein
MPDGALALFALGAVHGINPAMGWLFAVGIGLQERDRRAVWRALGPLALGHALAIGGAVLLAATIGLVLPPRLVRWIVATSLIGFGILRLVRHGHFRWGGMRLSSGELTTWSFLMASAHGAGLMILPLVVGATPPPTHQHAHLAGLGGPGTLEMSAPLIHTVGYLAVTTLLAVIVYEKVGLQILRRAWINLDVLWAAALIVAGGLTILV